VQPCNTSAFSLKCRTPILRAMLRFASEDLPQATYPAKMTHLVFVDESLVFFVTLTAMGSGSVLHKARINWQKLCLEPW
jgi:hypothetical protein